MKTREKMRRATLPLMALALAASGGCRNDLLTEAEHDPVVRPTYSLVNGSVTPIDGGLVTTPVVTITQMIYRPTFFTPAVSGDLACYADEHSWGPPGLFRFSSGTTTTFPGVGPFVNNCAIDGNHIALLEQVSSGSRIMLFDVGTSALMELDPQSGMHREMTAIGGNTVAFVERPLGGSDRRIRVVDLATPNQSLPLAPPSGSQIWPSVSPDGNLIVWNDCDPTWTSCQALKAVRAGGTWGAPEVVATGTLPLVDTDGSYIVYDVYDPPTGESHIQIQSVAGGPVTKLSIPGSQYSQRIDAGVVSFGSQTPSGWLDVFVYVIATNTVYRISDPGTSATSIPNVSVLSGGQVRVVWSAVSTDGANAYAFGRTFTPAAAPTFSFGGFLAPVQGPPTVNRAKAGAAIPVKFSLGGDRGLNIFASGSPTSVTVTCDAAAPTGTVEETLTAGGSGLSYDAASDTYSYVWKTSKAWATTCRRLTLRFVDGTVASADFEFK